MYRSYKTEIKPDKRQINYIEENFRIVRHAFNLYLKINCRRVKNNLGQIDSIRFYRWYTGEYLLRSENAFRFTSDYSRSSLKHSISNAYNAVYRFSKDMENVPGFKKSGFDNVKLFFPDSRYSNCRILCNACSVRLPGAGRLKLKEKGYFPDSDSCRIKEVYISKRAGRYYISLTADFDEDKKNIARTSKEKACMDLSVGNISSPEIEKLRKKIRRERRSLIRKQRFALSEGRKGGKNIEKQRFKLYKLRTSLSNTRKDCIRKSVNYVVGLNPQSITLHESTSAVHSYGEYKKELRTKCRKYKIRLSFEN